MKKALVSLLLAAVCLLTCSCALFKAKTYTVAIITTSAGVTDRSAAQGVYRGVAAYCEANGISYKEYVASADTDESVIAQIKDAAKHGAQLMIFAGDNMGKYADAAAAAYKSTDVLTFDCELSSPTRRTHSVMFAVEQAAFLAGYAVCAEGYTSLGFIAGERSERNESYLNGFVQGMNYYAEQTGALPIMVTWFTGVRGADKEVEDTALSWFNGGTQIIVVCGDGLYRSLNKAANMMNKNNKLLIGTGLNQSGFSERYLTTAACEYQLAAENALEKYFANGGWGDEGAGKTEVLGIKTDMVGLPTDYGSFRFTAFSKDAYETFYAKLKYGTLGVTVTKDMPAALHCGVMPMPDGLKGTETETSEVSDENS